MKPLSTHELLLQERYYYQDRKWEAQEMPCGDERAIRLDIYNKIIDVLNAAIFRGGEADTERIQNYVQQMEEKISQITE